MMLRVIGFVLAGLLTGQAAAQCRTATVDESCGTASGKLCKVKTKSSYGGKMESEQRSGEWTFTNDDGRLFKKGEYLVTGGFSNRTGTWTWFNENGQPLVRVKFANDRPQSLMAVDSGIAVCGEDSAWVFSPDSAHFVIRFRMKNLYKAWVADELMKEYDLHAPAEAPVYPPVPGVIGKNEELQDAAGAEPARKNIYWTDEVTRAIFPQTEQLLLQDVKAVAEEFNLFRNPEFRPAVKKTGDGKYTLNRTMIPDWGPAGETPDVFVENGLVVLGFRAGGLNYEVIQGRLKKPLQAGKRYCFSFNVKLKKDDNYCLNRIGAWFTHRQVAITDRSFPEGKGMVVRSPYATPMAMRDSWMTIRASFTALGGEQNVYFSQFSHPDSSRLWPLDSIFDGSTNGEIYYYLRNPVLTEIGSDADCPCNADQCPEPAEPEEPEKTQIFVLEAVQFNTGSWDLLETAYPALDSLAGILEANEALLLDITGHTDNQGKPADNLKLSEKRAKAVFEYLASQGVDKSRMTHSGKGDTEPVEDNETEEGQKLNRRVEFRLRKGQ